MTQNYSDILPADSLSSSLDKIEGRDDTLRDLFAGTTAPSSPVAYQLWADTTTNKIKQRNAANTDWVILGDLVSTDMGHLRTDGTNTMSASLNFNSNKGINCTDPVGAQDVATKNYVDTTAGAAGSSYLAATVDTSAGGSTGLVTASGSSVPSIAWSATLNSGFTINPNSTTGEEGFIRVNTAGTYLISARIGINSAASNGDVIVAIRTAAGSSGTFVSIAQQSTGSPNERTVVVDILRTFSALDTFDITFNALSASQLENNAAYTQIYVFRVV